MAGKERTETNLDTLTEITEIAESLWGSAVQNTLDHQKLPAKLQQLDNLFMTEYHQAFPPDHESSIYGFAIHQIKGGSVQIGYEVDERVQGLRILFANWNDGKWFLIIGLFHEAYYHRLDLVSITHNQQTVSFKSPAMDHLPSGTLPTEIVIEQTSA